MRKIFLSFLGTNKYISCNYFEEGNPEKKVSDVKYIQEALIKMYCQDFTENDVVLLFLTEKAEQMNFWDNGQYNRTTGRYDGENEGLHARLGKLAEAGQRFNLKHRRIKEGFSQPEIWSIFDTVANEFQEGDEVIFDITHAFRFLPMLGVVLMNYLKTTKNVKVTGIHYGAFEKLGVQAEVNKLDIKDRNAPILNLNTLLEFQSWTSAVNSFIKFGEVGGLNELSQPQLKAVLSESQGKDESASSLRFLIRELSELTDMLQTNRLNLLIEKDFGFFDQKLREFPEGSASIKPFKQILKLVKKKMDPLLTDKRLVWLESAKWCVEHNLVQQAYTQLQEGLLTFSMESLREQLDVDPDLKRLLEENNLPIDLNTKDKNQREFYGSLLYIIYQTSQNKRKLTTPNALTALSDYLQDTAFKEIGTVYAHITEPRNDINHAGMRAEQMNPDRLKTRIGVLIGQVESLTTTL